MGEILEATGIGFLRIDAERRLIAANRVFADLLPDVVELLRPGIGYAEILAALAEWVVVPADGVRLKPLVLRRDPLAQPVQQPVILERREGGWVQLQERLDGAGGLFSIWSDAGSQVRSAKAAETARRQLAAAVAGVPEGFALFDADDRVVQCNPLFRAMMGPGAVVGARFEEIIDDAMVAGHFSGLASMENEERQRWRRAVVESHRSPGRPVELEIAGERRVRLDERPAGDGGTVALVRDVTLAVPREDGPPESGPKLGGPNGASDDIRRRNALLAAMLDNLDQGIVMVDADLTVLAANRRLFEMTGLPFDTLSTGRLGFEDIVRFLAKRGEFGRDVDVEAVVRARVAEARRAEATVEELVRPDGTVAEVRTRPLAGGGFVRTYADISTRKRAEGELARKTALLELTLENMGQGLTVVDGEGRVVAYNRQCLDLLNVPEWLMAARPTVADVARFQITLAGLELPDGTPDTGQDLESKVSHFAKLGFGGTTVYERRQGDGRVLEVRLTRLPDGGEVGVYTDITARRHAEEEGARHAEALRVILDNMSHGMALVDADGHFAAYNRKALDLLGLPEALAQSNPTLRDVARYQLEAGLIVPPPGAPALAEDPEATIDFLMSAMSAPDRETTYVREQADGRVLEVRVAPLENGGQVRSFTDVTASTRAAEQLRLAKERAETALAELRRAQESLVQAEKMASLAQIVAGVAHEINTPVGVTLTAISYLAEEVQRIRKLFEAGAMRRAHFEEFLEICWESTRMIFANIERATRLIQSFKQVAVDQASAERRSFDLAEYLGEILLSLRPRLRHSKVRVITDIAPGLTVDGYPGAFSQVISNLIINALVHAFDEDQEGTIHLDAREATPGLVELVYRDDGKGIPAQHLPRIFDPFFTTKRNKGASGLGLNVVYNLMVTTMRGQIAVDSVEGVGTTFTLRFPLDAPVS